MRLLLERLQKSTYTASLWKESSNLPLLIYLTVAIETLYMVSSQASHIPCLPHLRSAPQHPLANIPIRTSCATLHSTLKSCFLCQNKITRVSDHDKFDRSWPGLSQPLHQLLSQLRSFLTL